MSRAFANRSDASSRYWQAITPTRSSGGRCGFFSAESMGRWSDGYKYGTLPHRRNDPAVFPQNVAKTFLSASPPAARTVLSWPRVAGPHIPNAHLARQGEATTLDCVSLLAPSANGSCMVRRREQAPAVQGKARQGSHPGMRGEAWCTGFAGRSAICNVRMRDRRLRLDSLHAEVAQAEGEHIALAQGEP